MQNLYKRLLGFVLKIESFRKINPWKGVCYLCTILVIAIFLFSCEGNPASSEASDNQYAKAIKDDDSTQTASLAPYQAEELTWQNLKKVSFEEKYYKEEDAFLLFPTFSEELKEMEGKQVFIKGYVIPVEPGRYVLSANPFSSCFFCGNAGPESVMELELEDQDAVYYTDEYRVFQGIFHLNDTDVTRMNYILAHVVPFEI